MSTLALIVEDDPTLRQLVGRTLKPEGIACIDAANGFGGVKKALSYLPDLVICDHYMPYASGLHVLQVVRATRDTKDIPFILMSSDHRSSLRERYLSEGANACIQKPFSIQKLRELVRRVITRGTLAPAL